MYEAVIGLEIHSELKTKSKIFCACENSFGKEPNSTVCPVCMGLPGALPVLNEKVVELALKAGLSLNCKINKQSFNDRKNYFYPDLPKSYQITQDKTPLCFGGYIELKDKKVRITRIHIEEDAGKLIHNHDGTSYVDFNRCGVPLIEIVTEPDIATSDEAIEFLKCLKSILEYADVSDCKMQEGSLRCDINISLRPSGSEIFGTRCEIKNLNSFSAISSSIEYEIKRQSEILDSGNEVLQQTLRWDENSKKTIPMRTKEDSHDYRFFPEPDLLPIEVSDELVERIKKTIPEFADSKKSRYISDFNLSLKDAEILTSDRNLSDFFDECVKTTDAKLVANWLLCDVSKILNEKSLAYSDIPFTVEHFLELLSLIEDGVISTSSAKRVLAKMFDTTDNPKKIVSNLGMWQISDEEILQEIINKVLDDNPESVGDFHSGKDRAFGFLVGQAMKESSGRANPKMLNEILKEVLNK